MPIFFILMLRAHFPPRVGDPIPTWGRTARQKKNLCLLTTDQLVANSKSTLVNSLCVCVHHPTRRWPDRSIWPLNYRTSHHPDALIRYGPTLSPYRSRVTTRQGQRRLRDNLIGPGTEGYTLLRPQDAFTLIVSALAPRAKSKPNNLVHWWLQGSLQLISQSTCIVV